MNRYFLIIGVVLLLSGCFQQQPMATITIAPKLNFIKRPIGKNRTVAVVMQDFRPSRSMGVYLHGIGLGRVETRNNLRKTIGIDVKHILEDYHFQPKLYKKTSASRILYVQILQLHMDYYAARSSNALIRVIAFNGNKRYQKNYYDFIRISAGHHEPNYFKQIMNQLLANVLNKMMRDHKLFSFLAR